MEKKWKILYTMPNSEMKISKNLDRDGIENYLPLKESIKQWSDRKKRIIAPLLPNYIFVKVNQKENDIIFSNKGILNFVSFGGKPYVISEELMDSIKITTKFNPEVIKFHPGLDEDYIFTEGIFKGLKGTIREIKGKYKIIVNIKMINLSLIVDLREINPNNLN